MGAKYLWDEIPAGVEWASPENRLIFATGPVSGTRVGGSGTISIMTKGVNTGLAASSQANGFLAAYLKFSGYDAVIVQGTSAPGSPIEALQRAAMFSTVHGAGRVMSRTQAAGKRISVTFTPHLVPMTRGLLATAYLPLLGPLSSEDAVALYRKYFAAEPFVHAA